MNFFSVVLEEIGQLCISFFIFSSASSIGKTSCVNYNKWWQSDLALDTVESGILGLAADLVTIPISLNDQLVAETILSLDALHVVGETVQHPGFAGSRRSHHDDVFCVGKSACWEDFG